MQAGTRYSKAGWETGHGSSQSVISAYSGRIPDKACGRLLLKSYLGMFEGVHDKDGEAQTKDVGQEAGIEVGPRVLLQTGRQEDCGVRHGVMSERVREFE